jgi:mRNA interferase MazF
LIVQADDLGADLPQTLLAMITSNMSRAGHPSRVIVRVDDQAAVGSGLLLDSIIMTDNLATIHRSEIDRPMGSPGSMTEVDAALRTTLRSYDDSARDPIKSAVWRQTVNLNL